jgi:hypothetical protein
MLRRTNLFRKWFAPARPPRPRRRAALLVESLEDRCVPTTFTVTNLADAGAGSLRQAIIDANNAFLFSGPSTIVFDPATASRGTINLQSALPAIAGDVDIEGPGADFLTVTRAGSAPFSIFDISSGTIVTLAGLTVSNGSSPLDVSPYAPPSPGVGGGIDNHGILTVRACALSGNTAGEGGAVYNDGLLRLVASTLNGNSAISGGAVYNMGNLLIVDSTLTQNTAATGGGVFVAGGSVTLSSTTLDNNRAQSGPAGGIGAQTGSALLLYNTIVAQNYGPGGTPDNIDVPPGVSVGPTSSDLIGGGMFANNPQADSFLGLGPLQDNGGPTWTQALALNSPAHGTGNRTMAPAADQRGLPPAPPGPIDVGAFQAQPAGTATHFIIGSGSALAAVAHGSVSFTVQAVDDFGNLATGYTGKVHFTSSDPNANLPRDYTFTSGDQGSHTFSATLVTPGAQSLTVTDITSAAVHGSQQAAVVVVATQFVVSGLLPSLTAGAPYHFTVTAEDAYGDVATGYRGTVKLTSSDTRAVLPSSPYTFTAQDAGQHVFGGVALLTAGNSQTLTVADTANAALTKTSTVSVGAAPLAQFVLSGDPASLLAGKSFTLTVTAEDAYGNTVTNYVGTIRFSQRLADAHTGLPLSYTFVAGDHGVHGFGVTLYKAGLQALTVTDSQQGSITDRAVITVRPLGVSQYVVTGGTASAPAAVPTSTVAGTPFTLVVSAEDKYGNVVPDWTGPVRFSSTDTNAKAVLPKPYTFTAADKGTRTFTITLATARKQTLTLAGFPVGNIPKQQWTINVSPGAAAAVAVTAAQSGGFDTGVQYAIVDSCGNTVPSFTGKIHFSSTLPWTQLPPDVNSSGSPTGSATVKTYNFTNSSETGDITVTAIPLAGPSISGSVSVTVPGDPITVPGYAPGYPSA